MPGKAPSSIGTIEQNEDSILAGDVGDGGAEGMGIAKSGRLRFKQHQQVARLSNHRMDGRRKRDWYIDNDVIDPLAQHPQYMSPSRLSDVQLRIQVLISGNQANSIV